MDPSISSLEKYLAITHERRPEASDITLKVTKRQRSLTNCPADFQWKRGRFLWSMIRLLAVDWIWPRVFTRGVCVCVCVCVFVRWIFPAGVERAIIFYGPAGKELSRVESLPMARLLSGDLSPAFTPVSFPLARSRQTLSRWNIRVSLHRAPLFNQRICVVLIISLSMGCRPN